MRAERIAFIICVNNEQSYEECLFYINRLTVPEGFEVEVFAIREAESIYKAYNYAMQQSDAKYKIYMHQDVMLIEKDILLKLVEMFQSRTEIGMIGLIGGKKSPENKRFYRSWDTGNVLGCDDEKMFWNRLDENEAKVWAIDGMFMATQYDISWREELEGWDFYDFSQSLEFREHGYEVWVPKQETPWSIHDCGLLSLSDYDARQEKFLQFYKEQLPEYDSADVVYPVEYQEKYALMMDLKEQMKELLFLGKEKEVRDALERVWDGRFVDTEFIVLKNILDILQEERDVEVACDFLHDVESFQEVYEKYQLVKYSLWRERYANEEIPPELWERVSEIAMNKIKNIVLPV